MSLSHFGEAVVVRLHRQVRSLHESPFGREKLGGRRVGTAGQPEGGLVPQDGRGRGARSDRGVGIIPAAHEPLCSKGHSRLLSYSPLRLPVIMLVVPSVRVKGEHWPAVEKGAGVTVGGYRGRRRRLGAVGEVFGVRQVYDFHAGNVIGAGTGTQANQ